MLPMVTQVVTVPGGGRQLAKPHFVCVFVSCLAWKFRLGSRQPFWGYSRALPRRQGSSMLKQRVVGSWLVAFAVLLMAGCGGSNDTITGGDDGGTDPEAPVAADIVLLTSSPQLLSSADLPDEGVTISAQVIDENGSVVPEPDVTFSIPVGSGVLTPVSDSADGTVKTVLTTAGDPANRVISVTAESGEITTSINVSVVGTSVTLTGPSQIGFGQQADYTVTVQDAAGDGLAGVAVELSTDAGSLTPLSGETDSAGILAAELNASADGTVSAMALGLTSSVDVAVSSDEFVVLSPASGTEVPLGTDQEITVQWLRNGVATETAGKELFVSSTRGTLSATTTTLDANGEASFTVSSTNAGGAVVTVASVEDLAFTASVSIEFVATTPAVIDVQASPSTISINGQSTISAIVRDTVGNLVKNQSVSFSLTDVTNGTLSAASAVTNSQGIATTTYLASSTSSANGGVKVTASVAEGTISDFATLTVGGSALFVTIGTGNTLFEPNETVYDKPFTVIITDSAGNAVPAATHRISVLPHSYYEGEWGYADTDGDRTADAWAQYYGPNDGCPNEDVDFDGVLDAGEDYNSNLKLDPGSVVTVPSSVELDDTGSGQFNLRYPQDRAGWVNVILRVVAAVDGTETTAEQLINLPISADDVDDLNETPPGAVSPYGAITTEELITGTICTTPD